ncbi:hypothetical protein COW36_10865 [bacterium (Candidatus Blackallbacteria) CG17_big_fil_post_rev_8_21_14_2_50_48_46]|uniref:Uncharacterized protein n=1 Tax=bacterium (Candidatus Blackallbacteria) CG17_big_fil_post_rev_8_21_14_2_50_48_46 TaxID=2014261 RepID=A0A2M7G520_9BACT|nr:MAG: hypothetical protein COW64_20455 [bacterium (Candidatus Blackallbacteria) CG18_big_fil_WC_8_21_14_2_50_49_26]PIW16965.1 MAG: hypothetical protein COW36_10865 [bacterium (Candidatus Blackallbacteria) CG17_big_fil_post_rev_8_21_14_2_50_48_46]PIW50244.1 MAG: hypothetical protein COW20_03380 [bacterium (Candidatus Blackallbacteria) CG13_big_fil_rev_8_21_14_2_50_49_14]
MTNYLLQDLLALLLAEQQLEAQISNLENHQESLVLRLDPDSHEPLELQIFSTHPPVGVLQDSSPPSAGILYFFCEFPHHFEAEQASESTRLISYLNELLPLGSLEITAEGKLYYRYGLLTEVSWPDIRSALEISVCLAQILPEIRAYLSKILSAEPPVKPEFYQELRKQFRMLLNQKATRRTLPEMVVPPHEWSSNSRYGLAYFLIGFLSVVCSTLATPWVGSNTGLYLGLLILTPGFFAVYHQHQKQRKNERLLKRRAKFNFYFQMLESEHLRAQSHAQELNQQRDSVDYSSMNMRQTSPDTPNQLLRLHQGLNHLVQFQERLIQYQTEVKKRLEELELSQEHLKLEYQLFLSEQANAQAELPPDLPELKPELQQDLIWPQLKKLTTILNFLEFQSLAQEPLATEPGFLQVQLPHNKTRLLIQAHKDWQTPTPEPLHTWMLTFSAPLELKIPLEEMQRVRELLVHFNRFMPIGSVRLDSENQKVILCHHFIRLQGDISNFLLIEILEILNFFSLKLEEKLKHFLNSQKSLPEMLQELETEFISLIH